MDWSPSKEIELKTRRQKTSETKVQQKTHKLKDHKVGGQQDQDIEDECSTYPDKTKQQWQQHTGPFQGHPNLKKSWSTVIHLCGDVLSKHNSQFF